ncbi:MAG: HPP family protein [Candidatus Altiarchaeota archaeon]
MTKTRRTLIAAGLACIFAILLAVITDAIEYPLLFASLASSIVVVFTKPDDEMSRPRAVVGSHLSGALSGIFSIWLLKGNVIAASGLSLFLLVFLMIRLNLFHPPAGGTAWSFVLFPQTPEAFIGLLGGALLLSLITLGGKDSLVLHFLFYFYGTPFHCDSPVETLNDVEEILEKEYKIVSHHPFVSEETRRKRQNRNEKIRKLMLLVLEDQIKDKALEEKLIGEISELDKHLEKIERPNLAQLDKKLDQSMEKLKAFIKEFGED